MHVFGNLQLLRIFLWIRHIFLNMTLDARSTPSQIINVEGNNNLMFVKKHICMFMSGKYHSMHICLCSMLMFNLRSSFLVGALLYREYLLSNFSSQCLLSTNKVFVERIGNA